MEKQTVFIKRYPSKGELPKIDDREYLTDEGLLKFEKGKWYSWWQADQYTPAYPNYFLEEIELPSEEEIRGNLLEQGTTANYSLYQSGHEDGVNFILNHLK